MFFFFYGRNIDKNRSVLFHINVFPLRKRFFNLVNALMILSVSLLYEREKEKEKRERESLLGNKY